MSNHYAVQLKLIEYCTATTLKEWKRKKEEMLFVRKVNLVVILNLISLKEN